MGSDSETDEEYTIVYPRSEEHRTGPDREEVAEIVVSQQEAEEQLHVTRKSQFGMTRIWKVSHR